MDVVGDVVSALYCQENFNLHFECKASDLRGIIEILEFNITLLLNNNSNH